MTEKEFVKRVSQETCVNKANVAAVIEGSKKVLQQVFTDRDRVHFEGLGVFKTKHRNAKPSYDFNRGVSIITPAKDDPVFIPEKEVVMAVNEPK